MKLKNIKESYYKLKCEEWFNEKNIIIYGMFATDKIYIPVTLEHIDTKTRVKITDIESWKEIYHRKKEVFGAFYSIIKRRVK